MSETKHFCVIGAGASGLTAIKSSLEIGAQVTCFERTSYIGGLWNYTDEVIDGNGSVAKSTVMNTCKELMAFSDFPVPAEFPNFLRHDMVLEYFHMYADEFNLKKHIRFQTDVVKVSFAPDYSSTGKWSVTYLDKKEGVEQTEIFDGVFVCNGHNGKPYKPNFSGLDQFEGRVIHTHEYKKADNFADKNILVIGVGNSGIDAAVELCRTAKSVHVSTRRGTWCFSRSFPDGMPLDNSITRLAIWLLGILPQWLADWYSEMFLVSTDHELLGLRPIHGPTAQAGVTVNDDFPNRILSGLIKIQPNVKCFAPNSVTLLDGTEIKNLDVVVLATGYVLDFPFLSSHILSTTANTVDLYKMVFPTDLQHPTLAVIGCIQPLGSVMPVSELQTRWASLVFTGKRKLPSRSEQVAEIHNRRKHIAKRYLASQRHAIVVDAPSYMDEIAQEVGCMPSLLSMLLSGDFKLAFNYVFKIVVPSQYRLRGPNVWPKARETIMAVEERVRCPLKTHISKLYGASSLTKSVKLD